MKSLIIVLIIAGAGYLWYDDNSNRRELVEAKAQITKLARERDMAMQILKEHNYSTPQAGMAHPPDWFQKRLKEKSPLNATNTSNQLGNHK